MNTTYSKKAVIITGSSRGIGAKTACVFAKNNFNIVITYVNNKDKAYDLATELEKKYKIKTIVIKCDVSKEEDVLKLLNRTKNTDIWHTLLCMSFFLRTFAPQR